MTKYILFCAQDANFQTRSMLIPYEKYIQCNSLIKDLDVLRKVSFNETFEIEGKKFVVKNLIVREIWGNESDYKDYYKITDRLTHMADGVECSNLDKIWYDDSEINLCRGFDHIGNFFNLLNKTKYNGKDIKIVESFLVLETHNGRYRI